MSVEARGENVRGDVTPNKALQVLGFVVNPMTLNLTHPPLILINTILFFFF